VLTSLSTTNKRLARAAFRCRCVSMLRILERQLPADGNLQLSRLHCLSHVEKNLASELAYTGTTLTPAVILGILGSSQDWREHAASFHFGNQLFGGLAFTASATASSSGRFAIDFSSSVATI